MTDWPDHRTLVDLALARFTATPRDLAYVARDGDDWSEVPWRDVGQRSRAIAAALVDAGVRRGDRVAIVGRTTLAWVETMLGVLRAGAVVTTVYPSSTPRDLAFILADAGCVAAFVEDAAQATRLASVRADLPALREVIAHTGEHTGATGLEAWLRRGRTAYAADPGALDAVAATLGADDLATLIYTSGTTGRPKGVMLAHGSLVAVCVGVEAYLPMRPDDLQLLFLPLSHVFGMVVCLVSVHVGAPTVLEPEWERLPRTLAETRPTFVPAVPRVFEKIYAAAEQRARDRGPRAHAVFRWAADVARRTSDARRAGHVPARLRAEHALADRLVLRKVRAGLGGRIRAFSSGAAPLSLDLARFFDGAGMVVLEGYGLTETAAITTVNPLEAPRLGTVGAPPPGLEVRIAPDGEILLRGPTLLRGYWNLPDETAAALRDGWLHTGDIGRFDDHGYLRITDRKKNLIVTSGGKNVAPAPIEHRLVSGSDLIATAMLVGDRRPYLVAMVALDPDALAAFGRAHGLSGDLHRHPTVRAAVESDVARVNEGLASFETVKAVHILETEPTLERGELTPSLKLRRDVILARNRAALDRLYDSAHPPS